MTIFLFIMFLFWNIFGGITVYMLMTGDKDFCIENLSDKGKIKFTLICLLSGIVGWTILIIITGALFYILSKELIPFLIKWMKHD